MAPVPLHQRGAVVAHALVSDSDLSLLAGRAWRLHPNGYAYRHEGHHAVWMHRVILSAPKGREVDHVNGDRLDNRRENLRLCSRTENVRNVGVMRAASSRFRGVHWCARRAKWRASIGMGGRMVELGRFSSENEAARAYDAAARTHYGAFARLNFPAAGEQPASHHTTTLPPSRTEAGALGPTA